MTGNEFQPEGNYYDKYGSKNPIVKKLMKGFFSALDSMLEASGFGTSDGECLEAGCGEGNVTDHICRFISGTGKNIGFTAFDISSNLTEENKKNYPNVRFFQHDIYEPLDSGTVPASGEFDLIVCSEVLEHLEEPEKAVRNLMQYGSRFIFSVPCEPVWRILNMARGKYLSHMGNTPGHIQHYSYKGFIKMLGGCGLKVVKSARPLPWSMVYCEKQNAH